MRYSKDIRQCVVAWVRGGGSKAEAARSFQVSRGSVYNWVNAVNALSYRKPGPKKSRGLEWAGLGRHVKEHYDLTQRQRARHFGVCRHCIWNALQKMGLTRKKMTRYQERRFIPRNRCLRLRERLARRGKTFVSIDESGFEPAMTRRDAYAPKGQRVYSWIAGRRRLRTSLIAARIGKVFEEPFLFDGPCNADVFHGWLERPLCPRRNQN